MEFEIKNLDFETMVKISDNVIDILVEIADTLNNISNSLIVLNKVIENNGVKHEKK